MSVVGCRFPHPSVLAPGILSADLLLLLGSEVVLDVECATNLLGRLPLDHVGHSLARNVQQASHIKVVGRLKFNVNFYGILGYRFTSISSKRVP